MGLYGVRMNFFPPMGLIVVLTRKRNVCAGAGECQDEASSAEEPEPALAPWESSAIGDVLWQLMAPFLGTQGGGGGWGAALLLQLLYVEESCPPPSKSPDFLALHNHIRGGY